MLLITSFFELNPRELIVKTLITDLFLGIHMLLSVLILFNPLSIKSFARLSLEVVTSIAGSERDLEEPGKTSVQELD